MDKKNNKELEYVPVPETTNLPAPMLVIGPESIKRASEIAKELVKILESQKLYVVIEKKKFITVEGWNVLGARFSVFPEIVNLRKEPERKVKLLLVKKIRRPFPIITYIKPESYNAEDKYTQLIREVEVEEIKYVAEARLRTINNVELSRAQAICSNLETGKVDKPEYVIASMAQTRSTGKVFRLAFSWIVKMAGFEPLAAEEAEAMNGEVASETTPKVDNELKIKKERV